ncbi:polymerase delta-interacting protein 3 [Trichoplax sp. H2]|nr:polymerase delta-interacting protein 3 [Trichoplax sp. H2]|eukprot:RDD37504.1 polymerase delta-interacting protein 3 [Trichoplax sp. H2]
MSANDPIDMSLDDYIAQKKVKSSKSGKKKGNQVKSTGKQSRAKGGKNNQVIVDARQKLSRPNERSSNNQNSRNKFQRSAPFDARQMIQDNRGGMKQKAPRRQDYDASNNLRRARRQSIDNDRKRQRSSLIEEKRKKASERNRKEGSLFITLRNERTSNPAAKNPIKFNSSTTSASTKNIIKDRVPNKTIFGSSGTINSSKAITSKSAKVDKSSLISPASLKVTIFNDLPEQTPKKPVEHVVVVSNLYYTVTEDDIKELFGAIGRLRSARLNTNGIAEVVYVNESDAIKAVSSYHNRSLDGYPMHCKLVTDHDYAQRGN